MPGHCLKAISCLKAPLVPGQSNSGFISIPTGYCSPLFSIDIKSYFLYMLFVYMNFIIKNRALKIKEAFNNASRNL